MIEDLNIEKDFVVILKRVKSYHCKFSVYIQYLCSQLERHKSFSIEPSVYSDIQLEMNTMLDGVDELQDLMNLQMMSSSEDVQNYLDSVTVLDYINDLNQLGNNFLNIIDNCMEEQWT